ncbi:hypothetical protein IGI04_000398 [Brassica rapa subsp. trilocularis]|uniref:Uncharacterized protein n=1 Tax=Brassica rapa subsp. trilocularis TaxID=1813537 RepID=A0ABQ7NPN1_BRACM|nr:hypothetical protein IGI04_000398 [Brassica rapa subsp. trilocularis]
MPNPLSKTSPPIYPHQAQNQNHCYSTELEHRHYSEPSCTKRGIGQENLNLVRQLTRWDEIKLGGSELKIEQLPQYQWPQSPRHGTVKEPKQIGQQSSSGGVSLCVFFLSSVVTAPSASTTAFDASSGSLRP